MTQRDGRLAVLDGRDVGCRVVTGGDQQRLVVPDGLRDLCLLLLAGSGEREEDVTEGAVGLLPCGPSCAGGLGERGGLDALVLGFARPAPGKGKGGHDGHGDGWQAHVSPRIVRPRFATGAGHDSQLSGQGAAP